MRNETLRRILWLILLLTLPIGSLAAGLLPAGKPEFEFIYDRLERIDALTRDRFTWQIGPYSVTDNRFSITPFSYLADIPPRSIELFTYAGEDFRAVRNSSSEGFESFRGGLAAAPLDQLFVYADFVVDEALARDPAYSGKKWRGLAGDVDEAFAYFEIGPLAATAGRFASFWGPRNSLVLSSRQALDGFGYTFRWGRLALSYRLARLDGLTPDRDSTAQFENRYFAGHRLDIALADWLQVAAFETVVFGGPGRQIDLYYLNPIIFFHSTQLNESADDNTFLGFDFSLKPAYGVKVYGQVIVDDMQIDSKSQSDEEPDQIGLLAGAYLADLVPAWDIKAEYTRVGNWTFNQSLDRNRYLYKNQPIGGALGNDYDLARLSVIRWFGEKLSTSMNVMYSRQGEGSITDEWTSPWLLVTGSYDEPFPTGIVQKTTTAAVNTTGFLFDHIFFDIDAGVDWVTNFEHRPDDNRTLPFVDIRISAFFSSMISVE